MTMLKPVVRLKPFAAALLLLVPLSGCLVVSLQPVYDQRNVEFSDALLGTWQQVDEDSVLTITRGAWNAYEIAFTDGADTSHMSGHLARIANRLVLDVTTASGVEEPPVTVQAHWLFLVEQGNGTLALQAMDFDWFKAHGRDKRQSPLSLATDEDGNVIIAAGAPALRDWLARNLTTPGVWAESESFRRLPPPQSPAETPETPRETEPVLEEHGGDDYTRYELLAPGSAQFKIVYEVTATQPGARFYFNAIRKGSEASDEAVYDQMTGAALPFSIVSGAQAKAAGLASADPDSQYIQVTLARAVPERGEVRLRIDKTYKDPQSYLRDGGDIVFSRSLGIRRNAVVLPAGYELVACNVPSQVAAEADGRVRVSFMHTGAGPAPLVVRARLLADGIRLKPDATKPDNIRLKPDATKPDATKAAPVPAPSAASRLAERARQDREIVYFLQQPETHAFALYHDYTERRAGTDTYLNVVRQGSRASNPSARLLDTGETLPVETLMGDAITRAKLDIGEPVLPATEVVVIRFPAVKPGQSLRLRIQETYTDAGRYYVEGDELVWDRSLGRPRNAVVLPAGWYLTASSIPGVVSMTADGRVRVDYDNPRPDEVAVLLKARRR